MDAAGGNQESCLFCPDKEVLGPEKKTRGTQELREKEESQRKLTTRSSKRVLKSRSNTGRPIFPKFVLCHVAFSKTPTLVPVGAKPKKEDFHFYLKRGEVFSLCFALSCYRDNVQPQQRERPH